MLSGRVKEFLELMQIQLPFRDIKSKTFHIFYDVQYLVYQLSVIGQLIERDKKQILI